MINSKIFKIFKRDRGVERSDIMTQVSQLDFLQVFARPVKSILEGLSSAAFNGAGSGNDEAISLLFLF